MAVFQKYWHTNGYLSRLVAGMLVCIIIVLISFGLLFYLLIGTRFQSVAENYLTTVSDYVINDQVFYILVDDRETIERRLRALQYIPWIEYAEISNTSTRQNLFIGETDWSDTTPINTSLFLDTGDQYHLKTPIFTTADPGLTTSSGPEEAVGFLHIAAAKEPIRKFYRVLTYVMLISCALGLLAVVPILIYWSRRLSRPVSDLQYQLEHVNFDVSNTTPIRISHAPNEIRDIADMVNDLISRVSSTYVDLDKTISERTKGMTEAMETARRSEEEKALLITNLSHELRSPLTAVLLYIDRCREINEHPGTKEKLRHNLDRAHRNGVKVDEELRILLQYSADRHRLDVNIEQCDIRDLVAASLKATQQSGQSAGNTVHHEHSGDTTVYTDRYRFKHTFENLLINAHKYCSNGTVTIHTIVSHERLTLSVTDTGDGIPPEHLNRIFEMHFQASNAREGGLGIGLALCKRWIESLNGTISASSDIDQPTTFRISMPVGFPDKDDQLHKLTSPPSSAHAPDPGPAPALD